MSGSMSGFFCYYARSEAVEFGKDEAEFINRLRYWVVWNRRAGRHHIDGRTWSYASQKQMSADLLMPRSRLRRAIQSLTEQGVILMRSRGRGADRTLWYAFSDEKRFVDAFVSKQTGLRVVKMDESERGDEDSERDNHCLKQDNAGLEPDNGCLKRDNHCLKRDTHYSDTNQLATSGTKPQIPTQLPTPQVNTNNSVPPHSPPARASAREGDSRDRENSLPQTARDKVSENSAAENPPPGRLAVVPKSENDPAEKISLSELTPEPPTTEAGCRAGSTSGGAGEAARPACRLPDARRETEAAGTPPGAHQGGFSKQDRSGYRQWLPDIWTDHDYMVELNHDGPHHVYQIINGCRILQEPIYEPIAEAEAEPMPMAMAANDGPRGSTPASHLIAGAISASSSGRKGSRAGLEGAGGGDRRGRGPRGAKGSKLRILPPSPIFSAWLVAMRDAGFEAVQVLRPHDAAALDEIVAACGGDEAKAQRLIEIVVAGWEQLRGRHKIEAAAPSLRLIASNWLETRFAFAFPPKPVTATGAPRPESNAERVIREGRERAAARAANARSQTGRN